MKFSTDFLDEIRARVPVSQVVGARVKLKKAGREWAGLSPFNAEKTPSFFVNDQKGFYHDFSSGKHGDVFTFLMETEGLGFPEAVERLAAMAGLPMPARSREGEERDQRRAVLRDALVLAAEIFETTLNAPVGAKARGYLADRGVDPAAQRQFGLGYAAPERFALRDALAARGVDRAADDRRRTARPRRGHRRALRPLPRPRDVPDPRPRRRVVAFGGRALEPGAKAKYLNSPETELFHKGELLFNHHRARKAAHERGEVIVVEGYVDVIAMTQAGFPHTVAPLGTALTSEQCALLWTMADEPILCFDGDKAGRKAAFRAIDVALPLIGPGKSLRFAMLPEGQDPDDLVRSGGAPAIAEVLSAAEPLAEMLFAARNRRPRLRHAGKTRRPRAAAARTRRPDRRRDACAVIMRPTWRAGSAISSARRARPRRVQPARALPPRGGGRFGRPDPGPRLGLAGAALPSRRAASSPSPARRRAKSPFWRSSSAIPGCSKSASRRSRGSNSSAPLSPPSATGSSPCLGRPSPGRSRWRRRWRRRGWPPSANASCRRPPARPTGGASRLRRKSRTPNTFCARPLALQRSSGALNRELKLAEQALAADPTEQNFARLRDIKANLADLANAEAAIEGFGSLSGRGSPPL